MKTMERRIINIISFTALLMTVLACKPENPAAQANKSVVLETEEADGNYPYKRLSTYGFFEGEVSDLIPREGVLRYQPASSLFTDYAWKSRFVYFPDGTKAAINEEETIDFPQRVLG